jgi:FixJ family two-component response regulator
MKVLFMSGYTDDAVVRHGVQSDSVAFLQKPFSVEALLGLVRKVLGPVGTPESGSRAGLFGVAPADAGR